MSALEITLRDHEYWLSIKGERYAAKIFIDVDNSMVVDLMVLHALSEAVSSTTENLASLRTRIKELEDVKLKLRTRIEELEADNHRLAQENINLNNNEDFLDGRIAKLEDALQEIKQWGEAYPLEVFPEPDFVKARELLTAGGQTLDAISAHNMRHVVTRVSEIARKALDEGKEPK